MQYIHYIVLCVLYVILYCISPGWLLCWWLQNDDLLVEDAYYSEMKETGYFEDWD